MPRQPEGKLVAKIKLLIADHGGRSFKIQGSDESFQEAGIPDLLCNIYGRFVGIEVKQPGAKLRPRQRLVLREIFDSGGVAAVVDTVGQVASLLSKLEKEADNAPTALCFDRGLFHSTCKFT